MTPSGHVRLERDGAVGTIVICRPPHNRFDAALVDDLRSVLDSVENAGWIRALVLRADGDQFSAGLDTAALRGWSSAQVDSVVMSLLEVAARLEELPFPTLAAARGACVSVGLELCLCCDLLWLGAGTRVGLPDIELGLVPLAGGVQRLAAAAGPAVARRVALGGRLHDAADFVRWGVADRELDPATIDVAALAYAEQLAQGPTRAYAVIKELLLAGTDRLGDADDVLLRSAADLVTGDDAREGLTARADGRSGRARFHGLS
jgi:enoyl-CoA hydratase/carnithine racemase